MKNSQFLYKAIFLIYLTYFTFFYFIHLNWILYRRIENIFLLALTILWILIQARNIQAKNWRQVALFFLIHIPIFIIMALIATDIPDFGLII